MTRETFIWQFVIVNWETLGTRTFVEAEKAWHATSEYLKKGKRG